MNRDRETLIPSDLAKTELGFHAITHGKGEISPLDFAGGWRRFRAP
jgi:hypothetical protein